MSDEEGMVKPAEQGAGRYGETLLYDFSKFLTSLSLLVLGGALALMPTLDRTDVKPFNIGLVLVLVALSGVTSLSCASGVAEARAAGREPNRHLRRYLQLAMALLGLGTGAFLMMWWDSLN